MVGLSCDDLVLVSEFYFTLVSLFLLCAILRGWTLQLLSLQMLRYVASVHAV